MANTETGGAGSGAGAKPAASAAGGAAKSTKRKRIVPSVTLEGKDENGKRVLHEVGKPVLWDAAEAEELIKAGHAAADEEK
jgi:hypothetical protein